MTRPNIEELDRLWEEATAGEWTYAEDTSVPFIPGFGSIFYDDDGLSLADIVAEQDARAIAALHNAYPELSAYVKSLEARIERTATRCRQVIHAHETSVEYADEFDALAANIARRVLSDLGETP